MFAKEKIVITTTTYYPSENETDRVRARLATETMRKAGNEKYLFIAVDGGSLPSRIEEWKALGVQVIPQKEKGMGNSRREAFQAAFDTRKEVIIWMEPEKHDFIRSIPQVTEPLLEGKVDLVIPRRRSLSSLPLAQQYIEPFANLFWKTLTHTDFDIWFGIRAMRREIVPYFSKYGSVYADTWDILVMPLMDMLYKGAHIGSVSIDYEHDASQTRDEENSLAFFKKRVEQLNALTLPLEEYWTKLHNRSP
ncbi:MAG: hypothetical protein AABY00_02675 [Nanoarchaeota archaeon]